jgi:hypothetical protein
MTFSSELNPHIFKFKKRNIADFMPQAQLKQSLKQYNEKKKKKEKPPPQFLPTDELEDVEMKAPEEEKEKVSPPSFKDLSIEPKFKTLASTVPDSKQTQPKVVPPKPGQPKVEPKCKPVVPPQLLTPSKPEEPSTPVQTPLVPSKSSMPPPKPVAQEVKKAAPIIHDCEKYEESFKSPDPERRI